MNGSVKEKVLGLVQEKCITINELEEATNLPTGTIRQWADQTVPNGKTLADIADYFGCSVDYLLGRESDFEDIMPIATEIKNNPAMRVLFEVAKGCSRNQLVALAKFIMEYNYD